MAAHVSRACVCVRTCNTLTGRSVKPVALWSARLRLAKKGLRLTMRVLVSDVHENLSVIMNMTACFEGHGELLYKLAFVCVLMKILLSNYKTARKIFEDTVAIALTLRKVYK